MLTIIQTFRHPAPLPPADRAARLALVSAQVPSQIQTEASAAALAATILRVGCRCRRVSFQNPELPRQR